MPVRQPGNRPPHRPSNDLHSTAEPAPTAAAKDRQAAETHHPAQPCVHGNSRKRSSPGPNGDDLSDSQAAAARAAEPYAADIDTVTPEKANLNTRLGLSTDGSQAGPSQHLTFVQLNLTADALSHSADLGTPNADAAAAGPSRMHANLGSQVRMT